MNDTSRRISTGIIALVILVGGLTGAHAAAPTDSGKIVQPDALAMIVVPNMDALVAQVKKSSAYAMYKDPAMREFLDPIMEEIEKNFNQALPHLP